MKFLRIALFILLSVGPNFAFAQTQTLTLATDATYPPFESLDASGKIQGFDIDIINAMCNAAQVKCNFVNQAWDSLIPSLQLGKFDAMFGAMNITPEREKQVDFTDPYYTNTASIVAPKSKNLQLTAASLQGKTIGVLSGSTFVNYLQDKFGKDVKVNSYASEQTAFLDLTAGRIDGVMGDTPLIKQWLKAHPDYALVGQPINDPKYFGSYGIAVKKGNTAVINKLNEGLKKIKASGDYQKIVNKYFGN